MTDEKATITIEVNKQDLWEGVFGSEFTSATSWYQSVEYLDGADWDKIGLVKIAITDPEDDSEVKAVEKTIGIDEIVSAWQKAITGQHFHCGGRLGLKDIEDTDACVGDIIIQIAVLGEVVYG